jgi:hypothetical protein
MQKCWSLSEETCRMGFLECPESPENTGRIDKKKA